MNIFNALKHINFNGDGVIPYAPWIGKYCTLDNEKTLTAIYGDIKAIYIKTDGLIAFIIALYSGSYTMYKVVLSTPFDISSVGTVTSLSFSADVWDDQSTNFEFSNNGLYFYYYTSGIIFRKAFANAWDNPHSNTLTTTSSGTLSSLCNANYETSYSPSTPPDGYQVFTTIKGFHFNEAGSDIWLILDVNYYRPSPYTMDARPSIVQRYSLATSYDITSTLTYVDSYEFYNIDSWTDTILFSEISYNGRYLLLYVDDFQDKVYTYRFGTRWNMDTITPLSIFNQPFYHDVHKISNDGKHIYIADGNTVEQQRIHS